MHTITLEGQEYVIRCDINVLEKINAKYGDIDKMIDCGFEGLKDAAAWMINEHKYYAGENGVTVTPNWIGARLDCAGYTDVCHSVISAIADCLKPKK